MPRQEEIVDLFVIGGGINGVGIARDAVGRGLSVTLAEMGDLASATSSASTKMFHGGLRYLEYFEVGLVRKALIEREVLLSAMPHISWPMRFVLPYHKEQRFEGETPTSRLMNIVMPWMRGRRPAWLIRLGLFMYDNLGGRKILPATRTVDLENDAVGAPLQGKYKKAFEYSDCWIEDARLVVLNARDAEQRGAQVWTRTKVILAERVGDIWEITTQAGQGTRVTKARMIVNSGGPWVGEIIRNVARFNSSEDVRLVRGSHIVTRKLFDHDKGYFFQGTDGRIIFTIPYETDFTLIGTTDKDHRNADMRPECTKEEADYLRDFASQYFKQPISKDDIVWTYSGVRPLYDDGAESASAATRDYVLTVDQQGGAPILNVFGGKITTYRKLAEHALSEVAAFFPALKADWTAGVALPGGDFPVDGVDALISALQAHYPFLEPRTAKRLIRAYGTDADKVLANAKTNANLGQDFGVGLSEAEVRWLMQNEYAQTAEDVVWRRSKLGLRMTQGQIDVLDEWMQAQQA